MSALLIEKGAKLSREDLELIPTPRRTRTHKPVSHFRAASLTVDYAKEHGYEIMSEEWGLNPSGTQMFGVIRVKPSHYDTMMTRCIGIRNSHNKTLAFGLTAGFSVMVCSNLCFGGEALVKRKHTSGINLDLFIPEIFDHLEYQYDRLEENIYKMKEEKLSINKARQLVVQAAESKVIPSCDIIPTLETYYEPPHEDFSPRTEWSLYNSFNEVAKKYSPARADKCYRGLARFFNLN